jgi:hypothetical protein
MLERLSWGVRVKPDRRLPPIKGSEELRAALATPTARLIKTHITRTRERKGGTAYEIDGRAVERRTVEEALAGGYLQEHDAGLFGPDDNPQSWTWDGRDD